MNFNKKAGGTAGATVAKGKKKKAKSPVVLKETLQSRNAKASSWVAINQTSKAPLV